MDIYTSIKITSTPPPKKKERKTNVTSHLKTTLIEI